MRAWRLASISVLIGACSAAPAGATARQVCLARARAAIAQDLGVHTSAVTTKLGEGGNQMPQCTYRARGVSVTVNVDNGPQAAWRLMRTVVEASQLFGPPAPGWRAPIGERGLGPYASWFPELNALMATNGTDLIDASVLWRHAKQKAMVAVARAAITPYQQDRHGFG